VYPFWSWKLLIAELEKHGVSYQESEFSIVNPDGLHAPINYLEKDNRHYAISFADDNEIVHPIVIESICAHFGLDAKTIFGISLP
jgi:ubiquinone biosynthesis protein COQ9